MPPKTVQTTTGTARRADTVRRDDGAGHRAVRGPDTGQCRACAWDPRLLACREMDIELGVIGGSGPSRLLIDAQKVDVDTPVLGDLPSGRSRSYACADNEFG
jgi:hypothetical protein